jgi:hypothetical protein
MSRKKRHGTLMNKNEGATLFHASKKAKLQKTLQKLNID